MIWTNSGLTHTCLYVEKFFVSDTCTFRRKNEQNRTTGREVTSWCSYNTIICIYYPFKCYNHYLLYSEAKCISLCKNCSPIRKEKVGKLCCVKNVCVSRTHPFLAWFTFSQDVKHIINLLWPRIEWCTILHLFHDLWLFFPTDYLFVRRFISQIL